MRSHLWLKKRVEERNLLLPVQRERPGAQGRRATGVWVLSGLGAYGGGLWHRAVRSEVGWSQETGRLLWTAQFPYTLCFPTRGIQAVSSSLLEYIKVFILFTCNVDWILGTPSFLIPQTALLRTQAACPGTELCLEQPHGAVSRAVCRKPASPAVVLQAALLPAPERAAEGCGPRLRLAPSEGSPPSPSESQVCSGFVGEAIGF